MLGNEGNMQENVQEPMEAAKKKGTFVPYQIAVGRLLILRKQYERAHDYLSDAVKEEVEVSSIRYRSYININFNTERAMFSCMYHGSKSITSFNLHKLVLSE